MFDPAVRLIFCVFAHTRVIAAATLLASVLALSVTPASAHQITSVEPSSGGFGTVVVIHGSGFANGGRKPGVMLTLGATKRKLKVLSATDDKIVARVKKAPVGVWNVTVRARGSKSVAPEAFTVGLPSDLTLDNRKVAPGDVVTVSGHNLGGNRGFVRVGSWYAMIVSRQTSGGRESFAFRVPIEVPRGNYDVQVGNPIGTVTVPAALKVRLTSAKIDNQPPKVASAGAISSTEVVVQFTEPVRGGVDYAENPAHYRISAAAVGAIGASTLEVVSAALVTPDPATGGSDRVRLTTLTQSNLNYTVKVVGVVDLAGNPLAGPSPLADPTIATFQGIAGGADAPDEDGDGLNDAIEQHGWFVQVTQTNGNVERYLVTSNPRVADTDGDGLDDTTEQQIASNPRAVDTDGDTLGDYQEFNEIYSDASSQDSDGDGLDDAAEFVFFRTSPIESDTDGDQLPDGDEVALTIRNPLLADLPKPAIEVGNVDLRLDVRFIEESAKGRRELQSKSVSSTLEQTASTEASTSDSNTQQASLKFSQEISAETSLTVDPTKIEGKVTTKVGAEQGWTGSWTHESSSTSSSETRRAYENSLQTDVEATTGSTVTREVVGARMQVGVTLKDAGGIAFSIRNLQLTAFIQDPRDPTRLAPVATLLPDAEPEGGFYIGPLQRLRGPIIFSNDTIFPSLVERLMQNSRGLVFRISNFDVADELGRNFVFTAQDVVDRTAAVVIDNGSSDSDGDGVGDLTEYHRVATGTGRVIDTDGDGNIDDRDEDGKADGTSNDANDHRVVFDQDGKQVGITLRSALATIGLTHYDEEATPTSTLSLTQRESSYSTITRDGVARIYRVRNVKYETGTTGSVTWPKRSWEVLTPTGIDRSLGVDTVVLTPQQDVKLAFVQDADHDALEARAEALGNCSDTKVDTDGDTLDDRFETLIGWKVTVSNRGSYTVFSSCGLEDSDGDGLTDAEEAPDNLPKTLDVDGDGTPDVIEQDEVDDDLDPAPTDPTKADTDDDGVDDKLEVRGYCVVLKGACHEGGERPGGQPTDPDSGFYPNDKGPKWIGDRIPAESELSDDDITAGCTLATILAQASQAPLVGTDPTEPDSDGDGASDGLERLLGGDPTNAADKECFGDDDRDGLSNAQEIAGWTVKVHGVSARVLPTPTPVGPTPTPAVGPTPIPTPTPLLCDGVCNDGPLDVNSRTSDPRKADTDDDGLSDAEEYDAGTNPRAKDTDGDGIPDFDEVLGFPLRDQGIIFTDPLDADTDDDMRSDGDETEWAGDLNKRWIVRVTGDTPYRVYSDPLEPDADSDRLVDGDERLAGTDPVKANTDGDFADDYRELLSGSNPLTPDFLVTITFERLDALNGCEFSGDPNFGLDGGAEDFQFDLGVIRPDGTYVSVATTNFDAVPPDPTTIDIVQCTDNTNTAGCWMRNHDGRIFAEVYAHPGTIRLRRSTSFGATVFDVWSLAGQIFEYDNNAGRDGLDLTSEGAFAPLFTGTTPTKIDTETVNLLSGATAQSGTTFFAIKKRTGTCTHFDVVGTITVSGLSPGGTVP